MVEKLKKIYKDITGFIPLDKAIKLLESKYGGQKSFFSCELKLMKDD